MHLLIIILYREDLLDEVLSGLVEMEITGAAVLDGTSEERILSEDVPIFAGLFSTTGGTGHTRTILASVPDRSVLPPLVAHLEEVGVDLRDPEVGKLFALPVDFYHGPDPETAG
jgi:nitrogen regulatory protein P-II 1